MRFRQVAHSVEANLRMQAHPNFVRWSICNGNPARVTFANCLGAFLISVSLLAYVLITLSSAPRGYRAIPCVGIVLGKPTLPRLDFQDIGTPLIPLGRKPLLVERKLAEAL